MECDPVRSLNNVVRPLRAVKLPLVSDQINCRRIPRAVTDIIDFGLLSVDIWIRSWRLSSSIPNWARPADEQLMQGWLPSLVRLVIGVDFTDLHRLPTHDRWAPWSGRWVEFGSPDLVALLDGVPCSAEPTDLAVGLNVGLDRDVERKGRSRIRSGGA
ncbi:hypothetical protein U1Q18_018720 [Sarracenia purpurea var. burkii]